MATARLWPRRPASSGFDDRHRLHLQGPVVILSRALGGPAVALFTTTRTVANVVRGTLMLLRAPAA